MHRKKCGVYIFMVCFVRCSVHGHWMQRSREGDIRKEVNKVTWSGKEREARESLKAYLGNVQGQWSNDECCSLCRPLFNLSLPLLTLTIRVETFLQKPRENTYYITLSVTGKLFFGRVYLQHVYPAHPCDFSPSLCWGLFKSLERSPSGVPHTRLMRMRHADTPVIRC